MTDSEVKRALSTLIDATSIIIENDKRLHWRMIIMVMILSVIVSVQGWKIAALESRTLESQKIQIHIIPIDDSEPDV